MRDPKRYRWVLTVVLAGFVIVGVATADPPAEDRAQVIGSRIRCPVCTGESIAASPDPIARQMMAMVRELVAAGYSDNQVIEQVIGGYDDSQLLDPRPSLSTALLWGAPILVLVGGVGAIWGRLRRSPQ